MIQRVTHDVWEQSGEIRMPGGVRFPLRATIVRLPDGGLWLHSPVPTDEAAAAAIDALGPIRHVVAPSLQHTLYARAARERWPEATLWGPASLKHELGLDAVLEPGPAFDGALEVLPIEGAPLLDEHCFLHVPSRSLLVTDLVFHLLEAPNLATSLLLRVVGCHGRLAASRSWGWVFAKDRAAVGASVARILDRDFDRLIPCHGAIVETSARDALREATSVLAAWASP